MKHDPRHRPRARGVTLIEVMIVIVILGLISGGVALAVFNQHRKAQIALSRQGAREMRRAASVWRSENPSGACPTPAILRSDKVIDLGAKLTDAWDTPYRIVCHDDETSAISLGPDKRESDDDLVEPDPIAMQ